MCPYATHRTDQRGRSHAATARTRPATEGDRRSRAGSRTCRRCCPAVTCTAQATLLTGKLPNEHGVVANGWLFRDTNEVRFWQQSNRLIQAEPLYETARKRAKERGKPFTSAKLFWWFNQGAAVDISRDAEAALRGRRQQGVRHHRRRRRTLSRCTGTRARAVPVPAVLGADGRREEHAVDRRAPPRHIAQAPQARPHARLPAAPRLRPAAVRAEGHGHGEVREGTRRRLRAAARRGAGDSARRCGW